MSLLEKLPGYDWPGTKDKWDALYSIVKDKEGYYDAKDIDLAIINIYKGDAYGLMEYLNIPSDAFYITLLINDMKTPTELDIKHKVFKVLNIETYQGMKSVIDAD